MRNILKCCKDMIKISYCLYKSFCLYEKNKFLFVIFSGVFYYLYFKVCLIDKGEIINFFFIV